MIDHQSHPLHVSQKVFWFSISSSVIILTLVFAISIWRNLSSSIEIAGIKLTTNRASQDLDDIKAKLDGAREQLAKIYEDQGIDDLKTPIGSIDNALEKLGMTKRVLATRPRNSLIDSYSYVTGSYETYSPSYDYVPTKPKPLSPKKK